MAIRISLTYDCGGCERSEQVDAGRASRGLRSFTVGEIQERLKAEAEKRREFAKEASNPEAADLWVQYATAIENAAFGAFEDFLGAHPDPTPESEAA
jgi:hypothetical protein